MPILHTNKGKKYKTKKSFIYKFDFKSASILKFQNRYTKFLETCANKKLIPHKWRLLQYFGLSFTSWRKELEGVDVVDWFKKVDYIDKKIQECHIHLIDKVVESNNENAISRLLEREQKYIFEKESVNDASQTINVAIGNFEVPKHAKIENNEELEIDNETINTKISIPR